MKITNRRARHEYIILDTMEAGIQLTGQEVKSVKQGRVQLEQAHVRILSEELFLVNANIPKYEHAKVENYDPGRSRRLLVKRKQITSLQSKMQAGKLTIVPISCYTTHGLIKIEIGLAKPKKARDKRRELREKDLNREVERTVGRRKVDDTRR